MLTAILVAATSIYVIDGDTIDYNGVRIRLLDIDTPELRGAHCGPESDAAVRAKNRLEELLSNGDVTYVGNATDRYGRLLAHVYVDGINVGDVLLGEGHALKWRPGREAWCERKSHWCGTCGESK